MNLQKNRLQQAGSASFTYDNEGQLATRTGDNYTFDDAHRLTGITGSVSYQYKYDGAGNRLEATRNGATTRYIYDTNGNLLAEADGTNAITRYYIYGNGLLAMVTSGNQPYCYHFDGTGHTVALTDSSANIVNRYAYTPFGAIGNQQEAISQPFKYVAKYGVMAEPNGLYYMKARYYDPSVGRFISEDPKGFDGGDVNLMAYTGNNPVMKTDPSGESGFTTGFEGAGTAFGFGGTVGIYGNFAHDSNKPWYKGWSSSVTFVAGGGAAASVYGAAAGVHFSGNNANNVSDLNGTFLNAGRAGLGALSLGGYRSPDGSVTGAGITVGPAVGYIGGIAGGSYTWTLGGGKWY
nr:RHS repeat-associated core domain-containing protein [Geobacter grbiciae]